MVKVSDLLARGRTFSFEFFPPKSDTEQARLVQTLLDLQPLHPSFVSVTYRGGPSSRQRTTDLVVSMLRLTNLNPMAHLTCAGHSRVELADILVTFRKAGIENLMALAGDPLTGPSDEPGELVHALELVDLARAIGGFCIGVAAHPGGPPPLAQRAADRRFLARKLRRADFAVTQFFFEAADYLALMDDLETEGLTKPVLPGVLPVVNLASIPRMAEMGCAVPSWLVNAWKQPTTGVGRPRCQGGGDGRHRAVRPILDKGAPGVAFLHAQPLRGDPADPRQPGPAGCGPLAPYKAAGYSPRPRRSLAMLMASGLSSTRR